MSDDLDWSGSWPALVFPGGLRRWAQRKLLLGVEVAVVVGAVVIGTAAKMAGSNLGWFAALVSISALILGVLEWSAPGRAQGHSDSARR